ncbi:hypothetical protein H310_02543 [Aphanomyces invadans]|uniref:Uncharacterized protein n=1 Tax=Aphanomyces invadans TaxID=157072 RepID=A0A024UK51_9STRA|nr:hypothetical protein H310_02543 [Aphanomyces invadans]ETW06242.1 hypothetical protein H310_02543 [Aphanomyces invadans]|eukprot:XP_008864317.1 hypothetical protein H310_02543 [Aphanomyces invadans]
MGGAESKPHLHVPFQRLSEWSFGRVEKLLTDYVAKDLDFGLDSHALSLLLDGDKEWSEEIVKAFGSPNGLINALTFITGAALAVMGDVNEKAALCFRAFDFSGTNTVSLDETTILFMCALRGFALITGHGTIPKDDKVEALALDVYRAYDKDSYSKLTKDEFIKWITSKLSAVAQPSTGLSADRFFDALGLGSDTVAADSSTGNQGTDASAVAASS